MPLERYVRAGLGFVLACLILPVLYCAECIVRIRFVDVSATALGHLIGHIDLYLRQKNLGQQAAVKAVFVLARPANGFVADLLGRSVPVLRHGLLCRLFYGVAPWLARTRFIMELPLGPGNLRPSAEGRHGVALSEAENRCGAELAAKYGIGDDDWFVTFHCRDGGFHKLTRTVQDMSYHDYRNSDIDRYDAALGHIIDQGGFAVRIGKGVEKPLTLKHRHIIDETESRSDFLDAWLVSRSKFLICGNSGIFYLAHLFNVPYAVTNMTPIGDLPNGRNCFYIPKLLRRTGAEAPLPLPELHAMGLICGNPKTSAERGLYRGATYPALGLEWVENSRDDILDLCRDMFDLVEGRPPPDEAVRLQRHFRDAYLADVPDRDFAPAIGPRFALKYRHLLDR
ncbi:conserved hypothetical protein [Candidatus Terasakiella magnetica]|nr:conserved hypothetical protein [Candidatus Terasakiella magnetica]